MKKGKEKKGEKGKRRGKRGKKEKKGKKGEKWGKMGGEKNYFLGRGEGNDFCVIYLPLIISLVEHFLRELSHN